MLKRTLLFTVLLMLYHMSVFAASVNLAWDYSQGTTPATGFAVYRATGTAAPVKIATIVTVTTLTYTDATVVAGNTYTWTVKAVDATGVESASSNAVTFQVPAALPAAPSNLRGIVGQ